MRYSPKKIAEKSGTMTELTQKKYIYVAPNNKAPFFILLQYSERRLYYCLPDIKRPGNGLQIAHHLLSVLLCQIDLNTFFKAKKKRLLQLSTQVEHFAKQKKFCETNYKKEVKFARMDMLGFF